MAMPFTAAEKERLKALVNEIIDERFELKEPKDLTLYERSYRLEAKIEVLDGRLTSVATQLNSPIDILEARLEAIESKIEAVKSVQNLLIAINVGTFLAVVAGLIKLVFFP